MSEVPYMCAMDINCIAQIIWLFGELKIIVQIGQVFNQLVTILQ